jgi:phage terminase large subunit
VAKQQASNAPLFAGIDVAGPGEDETVLTIRRGACVVFQKSWVGERSSGHVLNELAKFGGPRAFLSVNIDSAGMGEYFCEIIEDANYSVNAVNVGTVSADPGRFNLLKAELYWSLRERFEAGEISGLDDELAVSQLASIRYKHDLRGRVVIESKEDMKKRGVSSPDRAESLMPVPLLRLIAWLVIRLGIKHHIAAVRCNPFPVLPRICLDPV